jgi:hypothetical protein
MISYVARGAVAVLIVTGLSACSLVLGPEAPSATPTSSAEAPALGSAVDERCNDLLAPTDYDGLWDGELEPLGYTSFGASSTTAMEGTALVQSEALICSWSDHTGAPAALMIVMGDGADGFRRTEAAFADPSSPYASVPILDGAFVACRGDESLACHWNVLSGSDWISFLIEGVSAEQAATSNLPTSASAGLVSALANAVRRVKLPATPAAAQTGDCRELVTPDLLAEPLGVEAARVEVLPSPALETRSLEDTSPEFGQLMWKHAYDLLGYSSCGIQIDGHVIGAVVVAPAAAWVLHDSSALQPTLEPIGDYGDGVRACTSSDTSDACTVAAVAADDLAVAQIVAPPGVDADAIATAVLGLLLA